MGDLRSFLRLWSDSLRPFGGAVAIVPQPCDGLVTRRVLVMDFCAGVPVRGPDELRALGVDRTVGICIYIYIYI